MKNISSSIIIFATLTFNLFAQVENPLVKAEEWRKKSVEQVKSDDLEGAIKSLAECLKLNPKAATCYFSRGVIYNWQSKHELAISDLTKSLELFPLQEAYLPLAESYTDSGKNELAVSTLNTAISRYSANPRHHDFPFYYSIRAIANANLKKYKDAIADSTKALEIGGKDIRTKSAGQPYLVRAYAYCRTGDFDLAQYDEKKVKEFGGTVATPCNEVDSMIAAGKAVSVASAGNRTAADLYVLNGLGALVNGQVETAIMDFTTAINTYPSANAYYERGSTYFNRKKDAKSARNDIEQALKLNPNHEEARELKEKIDVELRSSANPTLNPVEKQKAEKLFTEAEKYFSDASYSLEGGKLVDAETNILLGLDKVSQSISGNSTAKALQLEGMFYVMQSMLPSNKNVEKSRNSALASFDKAIAADANSTRSYFGRGLVYEQMGNKSKAKADYQRALQLDPKDKGSAEGLRRVGN